MNEKLAELTDAELKEVTGGRVTVQTCPKCHGDLRYYEDEGVWLCDSCGDTLSYRG